jgi:plastocyanin
VVKRLSALAIALVLALGVLAPTSFARTQGKVITVALTNFKFGSKSNNTMSAKVGDSLKFVWKQGAHNVIASKVPAGTKKENSGAPASGHAPVTVKLSKKGTYAFFCAPHVALGMKLTVTVK